jgi:hypothetical protein
MYQQLGMDPSRMAFGYLIDKRKNNYPAHMVLLIYDENFKESPRFLDVLQSSGIASSMSFNDQLAKFDNFDATYAFFSKDRAFELDPETAVLLRPIKVKTKVGNSNSSQGIETQDRKEFTFDNIHSNLDKVVSDLMFLAKEGPTPLISKDDCL